MGPETLRLCMPRPAAGKDEGKECYFRGCGLLELPNLLFHDDDMVSEKLAEGTPSKTWNRLDCLISPHAFFLHVSQCDKQLTTRSSVCMYMFVYTCS